MLLAVGACLGAAPAAAQTIDSDADTLKEALALAYQNNPTLEAARANQRATDENVPIERADMLPSLSGQATFTEFLKQATSSFTAPARSLSGNLNLTVPIYAGGANKNALRAAETRVLAGRADLRGTESSLFSQVVAAYMDVIQNEALVGLAANNVDVLSVNLEATSDRFEIGDLTRTDVAQSESRLALARGDLRTAQANLIRAKEDFIALVGAAPDDLQPPPPLPGLPDDVDTAVDVALQDNPDLLGAHERARAAGFDVRVAGAGRLPRLEAFTSGGVTDYLGTLGSSVPGVAIQQRQTSAQAGLRATIPLFQGGRPAAQERQAQARASVALETIVATERDVIAQVRSAYASWRAANAIIASTQAAVAAAELGLEGVRAENTVGNRTILDILDAQQELLRAQVQLVQARRNAYVAGFTLIAAMGHAEARDLGLEEFGPLYDPTDNYERVRGIIWDWAKDPDPVTQSTRTVDIPAPDADIPDLQTVE
ncbi:MAG TPA: TolC family outer membrane protein [Croceibacterium sp.]|nr:TolC family outer membrane protein [Croceibacterium sp.]